MRRSVLANRLSLSDVIVSGTLVLIVRSFAVLDPDLKGSCSCVLGPRWFFILKLKAGVLSYHLRRKQLYITSRSERSTTNNTHNNKPQQNTTPPQSRREARSCQRAMLVRASFRPIKRRAPQPAMARSESCRYSY
jgi:hypothetical protein